MVRISPPLVYYDKVDGTYIKVGTGSWQHWLHKNGSFRYESFWGSFTAYKEHRGEEIVWYANRSVKEKARSAYLGSNHDLTLDKLLEMAKQLRGWDISYGELKSQTHTTCETRSFEPQVTPNEVELLNQISDLKKQLSHLQKQVDKERLLNANPNEPVKFIWN